MVGFGFGVAVRVCGGLVCGGLTPLVGETGAVDNLRAGARVFRGDARVFRELTALGFSGYLAVTYRW